MLIEYVCVSRQADGERVPLTSYQGVVQYEMIEMNSHLCGRKIALFLNLWLVIANLSSHSSHIYLNHPVLKFPLHHTQHCTQATQGSESALGILMFSNWQEKWNGIFMFVADQSENINKLQ